MLPGKMISCRRRERYQADLWSDLLIEHILMMSVKSSGELSRDRIMDENTIIIWIHSMHRFADVYCAKSSLTGQIHKARKQHVEQRESRIKRDLTDIATFQDWFGDHFPFINSTKLISMENGATVSEESQVNRDEAEQIDATISAIS